MGIKPCLLWLRHTHLWLAQSLEFVAETRILAEMKIENCGKNTFYGKKIDKNTFYEN